MEDWVLLTISRFLSVSVILMSFCMKLPQLLKIYTAGNNRGISIRGYWLEMASYSTGASYGYYSGVHYSNYLELVILAIQNMIIITLSIYYSRSWNIENSLWCTLFSLFICLSAIKAIPGSIMNTLILLGIPLSASSKSLQINALYKAKSSGDVSTVTWSLAAYGCGARLFTTIVEVSSLSVLTAYSISFILNCTVVSLLVYYGSTNKPKIR